MTPPCQSTRASPTMTTTSFAKILRGGPALQEVYEDDFAFAFHDIRPQAPVHVLVIPKGRLRKLGRFYAEGGRCRNRRVHARGGKRYASAGAGWPGYRLMVNMGGHGHQEVPHMHVHIFGGRQFFQMIPD